jgi:hypothetical protein
VSSELGPRRCCICDEMKTPCRQFAMMPVKGPRPDHGWGCVVCHLPNDGAIAVVCDECANDPDKGYEDIRFICDGYGDNPGRLPIAEFTTPHEHDNRFHPEFVEED